jgi:hypothetical protein
MARQRPPLTVAQIKARADAYHARTRAVAEPVIRAGGRCAGGDLAGGQQLPAAWLPGLSGGGSLARLLEERRGMSEEGGVPAGSVHGHLRTRRLSGTQRDLKKGGAADEAPPRPWRMQG